MLDFSNAPYQFFEPEPLRPLIALAPLMNRFLLRFDLGIREKETSGHAGEVRELIDSGARILFAPNHPTRTDPQFMGDLASRLGTHTSFMAAYDVFLESKFQGWLMQKSGSFSVDREGSDRKSMSTAIEILKAGEMALTIFPEGNVYHLNDRVTPILDGPAFIASKVQQSLKGEGRVYVVPVSFKYSQLTDVRDRLWRILEDIADDSEYSRRLDREKPVEAVLELGSHLIARILADHRFLDCPTDLKSGDPREIHDGIMAVAKRLLGELEAKVAIQTDESVFVLDRIRKVRSKVYQMRTESPDTDEFREVADKSIFAFRLLAYVVPYLSEKPTIDRYAETVTRIREDYYSKCFKPVGPRKGFARVGRPIPVDELIEANGGKARLAIPEISKRIFAELQSGVDEINAGNREVGASLLS